MVYNFKLHLKQSLFFEHLKVIEKKLRKYLHNSIKGTTHVENEDDLLIIEDMDYQLFLIFDGVSSAKNSKKAINLANEFISSNHKNYLDDIGYSLIDLMYDTNEYIVNSNVHDALTTYCAIFIPNQRNEITKISNLGDSRVYWMTKQYIEKLSIDDNLYPGSNVINKCLGIDYLGKSDFREETINAEDKRLLLCTDGFYKFLEEDKNSIFKFLNGIYLEPIKKNLVKIIDGKNKDDATYILIV